MKKSTLTLLMILMLFSIIGISCQPSDKTGASVSTSTPTPTPTPAPTPAALEAKEPESYSLTQTVTIQPTGKTPAANIPPLQFVFARMNTDRRLSFKLPEPLGEVIYLEKPTLKYLIFPARNQYVELNPDELGFQLADLMSPGSVVANLKGKVQHEVLGTETVNGRTAVKYRFKGSADTRTTAGTAQADSIVFLDQETGLPLKSEIDTTSTSGAGAHIVTSTDNLQLGPQPALFEVPTGMKKVTSTELKQQVQSFVGAIRVFAEYLRQRGVAPQPVS